MVPTGPGLAEACPSAAHLLIRHYIQAQEPEIAHWKHVMSNHVDYLIISGCSGQSSLA